MDEHNLRKNRAHRIKRDKAEQALSNAPILIYEQTVEEEVRCVYYGESEAERLLALVFTERNEKIRVIYRLRPGCWSKTGLPKTTVTRELN